MSNYTPVGDIVASSICIVMFILVFFSYNRHTRSFSIFLALVSLMFLATNSNVAFHMAADTGDPSLYNLAFVLRLINHAALFSIFLLFVVYILEVTRIQRRLRNCFFAIAFFIWVSIIVFDTVETFWGNGIEITKGGVIHGGVDVFFYGYVAFVALILVLLIYVRDRLYRNVMLSFYCVIAVSFAILFIEMSFNETSYTATSFLYPMIAMLYIMHSNPYDVVLGAVDRRAFEDMVKDRYQRGKRFHFMVLYLRGISEEGKEPPEDLQETIRKYAAESFRSSMLFQIDKGFSILVFSERKNPDYKERIRKTIDGFYEEHGKFLLDYKIVIGHSIDSISSNNEYVAFIRSILHHMQENTIHVADDQDVEVFNRREYIIKQLSDIYLKKDLDDPRVLAYCQPVYNIRKGIYDTAEALMRLKLDQLGLVYPDEFIPMAEENGYIHTLTEIILHKTCDAVHKLVSEGYLVSRISVNVSALELKDEEFCDDVNMIIDSSAIPGEKIAIELTESRNEEDFNLMKSKIDQLKERGIKFYLDDFGTGYSNMERIMELPFDIIKFDRSMVLASDHDDRAREIVSSLANMFSRMKYSVLYEGVEGDKEEIMCINMDASFLQGYKYSRPIPIVELNRFFEQGQGVG